MKVGATINHSCPELKGCDPSLGEKMPLRGRYTVDSPNMRDRSGFSS